MTGIALLILLTGFVVFSCAREAVSYCPFCNRAGIAEISEYDKDTGITTIYYKCTYTKCGKKFGAGMVD